MYFHYTIKEIALYKYSIIIIYFYDRQTWWTKLSSSGPDTSL